MTRTVERWTWEDGIWKERQPARNLPPAIAERLSEHWGATSLHGMVFRRPKGFTWWHCDKCCMSSTPSGRRSFVMPAHGAAQMKFACNIATRLRGMERDRFVASLGRPETVLA